MGHVKACLQLEIFNERIDLLNVVAMRSPTLLNSFCNELHCKGLAQGVVQVVLGIRRLGQFCNRRVPLKYLDSLDKSGSFQDIS